MKDFSGDTLSSVEFRSINNNKTCLIQSLDYKLHFHASVVTPNGVITCGGVLYHGRTNKCVRLTVKNTWEPFPSMNIPRYEFDMVVVGDMLVAFNSSLESHTFEMINWRNNNKWESVKMNKEFYSSCIAKWDDENVLIIGGRKTAHGVSNINIKLISLSVIKCFSFEIILISYIRKACNK